MELINDILQYDFLRNALLACILSGITCGIAGTYIVARRMVFLSGGITHASFGGLGIAFYYGFNPLAGALCFAGISAIGIEWASRRGKIREDSAIGIIWSVGMAIGALFMTLRPGYASDLTSYLFGSILLVDKSDILYLGIATIVVVIGAILWLRPIMYMTFDNDYAASQGIATSCVSYIMAVLTAVVIVLSIKIMGIILLLSLLTMPAVIVNSLSKSYTTIAVWSAVIAVIGNIAGFAASYHLNIPTGSCIIFTFCTVLAVVKLLTLHKKPQGQGNEKNI